MLLRKLFEDIDDADEFGEAADLEMVFYDPNQPDQWDSYIIMFEDGTKIYRTDQHSIVRLYDGRTVDLNSEQSREGLEPYLVGAHKAWNFMRSGKARPFSTEMAIEFSKMVGL